MWDIQGGRCLRLFSGHTGGISCISISDDGRLMASAGILKFQFLYYNINVI